MRNRFRETCAPLPLLSCLACTAFAALRHRAIAASRLPSRRRPGRPFIHSFNHEFLDKGKRLEVAWRLHHCQDSIDPSRWLPRSSSRVCRARVATPSRLEDLEQPARPPPIDGPLIPSVHSFTLGSTSPADVLRVQACPWFVPGTKDEAPPCDLRCAGARDASIAAKSPRPRSSPCAKSTAALWSLRAATASGGSARRPRCSCRRARASCNRPVNVCLQGFVRGRVACRLLQAAMRPRQVAPGSGEP